MFKGWFATDKEKAFLKTGTVQKNNQWYLNGELIKEEKVVALGRSCYYMAFIKTLAEKLGKRVFQLDFMTWDKKKTAWDNLKYYIDTAKKIHFSLRGVDVESLTEAFKKEGFLPYMTSREIRYIYHNPRLLDKTVWYVEDDETRDFLKSMGINRIGEYRSNSPELDENEIVKQGNEYWEII